MRLDGQLRVKDVAAILDISYTTVINYIKRGQLRAHKAGGQWRIYPQELDRFRLHGNVKEEENG